MSKTFRIWWIGLCLLFMALPVSAQKFFNLTSDEVKVDSVLPQFIYSYPLQGDYQDSDTCGTRPKMDKHLEQSAGFAVLLPVL